MNLNLFINLYPIDNKARREELIKCLCQNIIINTFKKIVCLDEGFNWNGIDKNLIEIIYINKRPTFETFANYFENGDINIIANSDIFFDDSIKRLRYFYFFKNVCTTLTRREADGSLFRESFGDSQDVWVFYGKSGFLRNCNFNLGIPGCDSKLLFEAWKKKYIIINPCLSIPCYHLHKDERRQYSEKDRLNGHYLFVKPAGFSKALFQVFMSRFVMKLFNVRIIRQDQLIV